MATLNTDRSVDLAVPAHVAREHLARTDDQPRLRAGARIEALSPRRCRLTVATVGPPAVVDQFVAELARFKRWVEQVNPPRHHPNERPTGAVGHPSNWRESRLRGTSPAGRG
jgi:hypothetical protein